MSIIDKILGRNKQDQDATNEVLDLVSAERASQRKRFGVQYMPNGINVPGDYENEVRAKTCNAAREQDGTSTWRSVLIEEVAEACNAQDIRHLEQELIQVAAVAVSWIEAIRDGRAK